MISESRIDSKILKGFDLGEDLPRFLIRGDLLRCRKRKIIILEENQSGIQSVDLLGAVFVRHMGKVYPIRRRSQQKSEKIFVPK
jgi:hypothetical protein